MLLLAFVRIVALLSFLAEGVKFGPQSAIYRTKTVSETVRRIQMHSSYLDAMINDTRFENPLLAIICQIKLRKKQVKYISDRSLLSRCCGLSK
jgi:hypothetical protein